MKAKRKQTPPSGKKLSLGKRTGIGTEDIIKSAAKRYNKLANKPESTTVV